MSESKRFHAPYVLSADSRERIEDVVTKRLQQFRTRWDDWASNRKNRDCKLDDFASLVAQDVREYLRTVRDLFTSAFTRCTPVLDERDVLGVTECIAEAVTLIRDGAADLHTRSRFNQRFTGATCRDYRTRLVEECNGFRDDWIAAFKAWEYGQRKADIGQNVSDPAHDRSLSPTASQPALRVDEPAKLVFWREKQLPMNSHADFQVFLTLHRESGAIVTFVKLFRAIKPDAIGEKIQAMTVAPPEVKEAASHIRNALKRVGCPYRIESVRAQGYRLLSPDE